MRILDVNDNELQEEEADLELGHLDPDQVFVAHHDAVEYEPREWHYWPQTYYFEDETRYSVPDEDDPHVLVKDLDKCLFSWNNLEGEEEKEVRGIDVIEIETKAEVPAVEAYDEYEDILRYILYTEEELEEIAAEELRKQKEADLLANGYDQLVELEAVAEETTETIDDLVLLVADIIGGAEEEEEEE